MAIKQRKQLTGTTAQINAYAGVEGQLVWDKTKKKWVGMSGTAGTNYPMASESHTHSISNVTNLQTTLDGKQPKGDYATAKALTDGLAGKANKAHTHAVADVTNLQTTLNTINDKIPKTGNRGALAGFSSAGVLSDTELTISETSPDVIYYGRGKVILKALSPGDTPDGKIASTWTKSVYMTGGSVVLEPTWFWVGGETPKLTFPCVLVCHAIDDYGIVGFVSGEA